MNTETEIIPGQRFGMLVTVDRYDAKTDARKEKRERWLCQCDCGKSLLVRAWKLRGGLKTNCGCVMPVKRKQEPEQTQAINKNKRLMPIEYQVKYGCNYCTNRKRCTKLVQLNRKFECRYAYILDDYSSYAEYEKKQGIPRTIIKQLLGHKRGE